MGTEKKKAELSQLPVFTVGIDPGVTGAISLLQGLDLINVWDIPNKAAESGTGKAIDQEELFNILFHKVLIKGSSTDDYQIAVERVWSRPNQSCVATFSLGRSYGAILGCLTAFAFSRVATVLPQSWQAAAGLIGKDKNAARKTAIGLYPDHADLFRRVKDHDRADAALIARYLAGEPLE